MTRIRILLPVAAALLIAQAACGSSTPTSTPIPAVPPAPTSTVAPSLSAPYTDDFSTNYAIARADALERGFSRDRAEVYAANFALAHSEARERGDTREQAAAYAANYADARFAAIDDFGNGEQGRERAGAYAVNYADARAVARERGDSQERADLYADAYAAAMDYGYAPDRATVYADAYAGAYMDRQDESYRRPYAYASAYAYARERGHPPQRADVYADAFEYAVRNYGDGAPQGLAYADGYLYAEERGDSDEEAAEYASFRASLYNGAKSEARSASVEEEPAQAFAFTFSRIYGEAAERRDYPDRERDVASAVATYTDAVSAGDAPERAAVYAAAYAAAIARGDAPQQAASYAAEYADANTAPTYRGESLPDMESRLSRDCCR